MNLGTLHTPKPNKSNFVNVSVIEDFKKKAGRKMNLGTLHLKEGGWNGDWKTGHLHHNDAGSELAARNAYQSTAESECKKSHPYASKISGIGRKPYTNCVNEKMSNYDNSVGAERAREKQAAEDARLALLAAKNATITQSNLAAETAKIAAETQQLSAKTSNIEAESSATSSTYMAYAGFAVLAIGAFFLYKKLNPSPAAVAAPPAKA